MNAGYMIYQAERQLSRAEQQRVDIAHAELARKVSRYWQALTAPLRALRSAGRSAGLAAGRGAPSQTGLPAGYQAAGSPAAEGLAECQAGECLTGRAA
jgi:hypothetical protein